jgi:hypothetical protein
VDEILQEINKVDGLQGYKKEKVHFLWAEKPFMKMEGPGIYTIVEFRFRTCHPNTFGIIPKVFRVFMYRGRVVTKAPPLI